MIRLPVWLVNFNSCQGISVLIITDFAFAPVHDGTEVELVGEAPGPGGAPHSGKSDFTILHLL